MMNKIIKLFFTWAGFFIVLQSFAADDDSWGILFARPSIISRVAWRRKKQVLSEHDRQKKWFCRLCPGKNLGTDPREAVKHARNKHSAFPSQCPNCHLRANEYLFGIGTHLMFECKKTERVKPGGKTVEVDIYAGTSKEDVAKMFE